MAVARDRTQAGTAERILDIAERLVQTKGFNNFSYADIAAELGITKASLHYHFPGKAELGQALIARYGRAIRRGPERDRPDLPDARAKLEAYAELYADVLRGKRMCMCGVLAGEYETLPGTDARRGGPVLRREPAMAHRFARPPVMSDRTLSFTGPT